jgi:glutamate N-acetyltransferase/amino-acid N-acetyltransferase
LLNAGIGKEEKMKTLDGGITAAKGFAAAHTAAGIKYQDREDMALIYSAYPCVAAGTFTTNIVKAAPVQYDQKIVQSKESVQAIVVNAGIANACTGKQGFLDCEETAKYTGEVLRIPSTSVLVASTGVIGMNLPIDRIKKGIDQMKDSLSDTRESANQAAKAIMTTDTVEKEVAVSVTIGGKNVTIGGMCKGSGMIHPNMCTMLSFLTSDVNISKELLQEALLETVQDSYNMISVDGDTSTNDTCIILSNGLSENPKITKKDKDYEVFKEALLYVNQTLAKKMAGDGEGATALFEVVVKHADSIENAKKLAKSVVTSSLTKAAIYGHDANWGRILCALGYSGVSFDPEKVDLYFRSAKGVLQIIEDGIALDYSEEEATRILKSDYVTAVCDMKMGDAEATAWGCDLTYDYVKINADYRS